MNVTPATLPSEPEPLDNFMIRDGQLRRWATRSHRIE